MPAGFSGGELRCGVCRTRLQVGAPRRSRVPWVAAAAVLMVAAAVLSVWAVRGGDMKTAFGSESGLLGLEGGSDRVPTEQEASIRVHVVPKVVEALDVTHPRTRNTAARIAAEDQGPFHVEQVARLWSHVREQWRYVNDPRGTEYFATASETIDNEFAGDCDDFAILLTAMISAVGGEARLVMMDGPRGGHAYAEACVPESPEVVRRRLAKHYARSRDPSKRVRVLHSRQDGECVWINLDWNAGVPGGPYEPETWAVAIYTDGRTEALAPQAQPGEELGGVNSRVRASSPPR